MSSRKTLYSLGINDLSQYARFQCRLQGVREHQVDPAAKKTLQVNFQVHVGIERFLFELYENVQIAAWVASCRATDPKRPIRRTPNFLISVLFRSSVVNIFAESFMYEPYGQVGLSESFYE